MKMMSRKYMNRQSPVSFSSQGEKLFERNFWHLGATIYDSTVLNTIATFSTWHNYNDTELR